jgi:large subunit ribosomal protein L15
VKLHELKPPNGARKSAKRVGRGPGSGNGKTSGKGHKGQKSRSGGGKGPGFEGGQMPLYRRLPKRGFNNSAFRDRWAIVNLSDLTRLGADRIDTKLLVERGLVKGAFEGIKILGDGKLERPIHIQAHAISAGARQKLEAAGGTFEVISR